MAPLRFVDTASLYRYSDSLWRGDIIDGLGPYQWLNLVGGPPLELQIGGFWRLPQVSAGGGGGAYPK